MIAFLIISILLILALVYFLTPKSKNFSLQIYIDQTNTRGMPYIQQSTVIYKNDQVIFANKSEFKNYRFSENYRCVEEYDPKTNKWKRVLNENWLDNESCWDYYKLFSSLSEINNAIKSGEIIKNEGYCHNKVCYSLNFN